MNQSINTDSKKSKEPQQKYRLGTVSIKILSINVMVSVFGRSRRGLTFGLMLPQHFSVDIAVVWSYGFNVSCPVIH